MNENPTRKHVKSILIVDDDADDRLLIQEALADANFPLEQVNFAEDGDDLLNYLCNQGRYNGMLHKLPDLILLDLNMPKKDGRQALKEIKANSDLRKIPVIILTTSTAPKDIEESYDSGANTFITKPVTFDGLVSAMQTLKLYWSDCAYVT